MKARARARHETVNSRFKLFGALGQRFRHAVERHAIVMGAVANISQIVIEEESPSFQIQYYSMIDSFFYTSLFIRFIGYISYVTSSLSLVYYK